MNIFRFGIISFLGFIHLFILSAYAGEAKQYFRTYEYPISCEAELLPFCGNSCKVIPLDREKFLIRASTLPWPILNLKAKKGQFDALREKLYVLELIKDRYTSGSLQVRVRRDLLEKLLSLPELSSVQFSEFKNSVNKLENLYELDLTHPIEGIGLDLFDDDVELYKRLLKKSDSEITVHLEANGPPEEYAGIKVQALANGLRVLDSYYVDIEFNVVENKFTPIDSNPFVFLIRGTPKQILTVLQYFRFAKLSSVARFQMIERPFFQTMRNVSAFYARRKGLLLPGETPLQMIQRIRKKRANENNEN